MKCLPMKHDRLFLFIIYKLARGLSSEARFAIAVSCSFSSSLRKDSNMFAAMCAINIAAEGLHDERRQPFCSTAILFRAFCLNILIADVAIARDVE